MNGLEPLLARIFDELALLPREAVLATVSPRGAEARVLMLRGFDPAARLLWLHTDAATPKLAEIAAAPGGTLLLRDAEAGTQTRLRVHLTVAAEDPQIFWQLSEVARENYGTLPPPGTRIAAPGAYQRQPDPRRFARIQARIDEIDFVDLACAPHRRAVFLAKAAGWDGHWVAP